MFNIGPLELIVLALVGLVVLGPDKLPGLARDAAQMLKTLRELATGARQQLRDELGPEFADVDLRNLNPRTAVTRAVFGDDFDARGSLRDALLGDSDSSLRDDLRAADPRAWLRGDPAERADGAVSFDKGSGGSGADMVKPVTRPVQPNGTGVNGVAGGAADAARPRPRPRPTPRTDYDDAT